MGPNPIYDCYPYRKFEQTHAKKGSVGNVHRENITLEAERVVAQL